MARYEVPVLFSGQCNFIIEAKTPAEARAKAELRFKDGDEPDELGNEWHSFDRTGEVIQLPDPTAV